MTSRRHGSLPADVEVLVAGSGAAGLTAALTAAAAGLSVLLLEAADRWGGTSAISGGRVWLPPANGSGDSRALAVEYMNRVFGPDHDALVRAFVESAHPMARFVEANSRHRFVPCPNYPDYYPDLPGWLRGGRAHDAPPVALDELRPEASDVLVPPGYVPITHAEWEEWRYPSRYDHELIESRERRRILTNGASLVASLVDGSLRAGACLIKNATLVGATPGPDQSTTATVILDGEAIEIRAAALILATGGFDGDPDLRSQHLPASVSVSASAPTNTGVALRIALDCDLAVENLNEGWWMPMVMVPGEEVGGRPQPRALVRERGVPHQIVVNEAGERFVDEAAPYHEFVKAMNITHGATYPNQKAWLVFDQQFRDKYSMPGVPRTGEIPSHIETADTIAGLAERINVSGPALQATVQRWNHICRTGSDPDFGRGNNDYDLYYGDPSAANPNLGPIEAAPFYATQVLAGTAGTKGGPVVGQDGDLFGRDGTSRRGWYAVGNAGASWTGDGYPGPGTTLGLGMTAAFRAATDAIRLIRS